MAPRGITRGEVSVLLDDLRHEVLDLYREQGAEIEKLKKKLAKKAVVEPEPDSPSEDEMDPEMQSFFSAVNRASFDADVDKIFGDWPDANSDPAREDDDAEEYEAKRHTEPSFNSMIRTKVRASALKKKHRRGVHDSARQERQALVRSLRTMRKEEEAEGHFHHDPKSARMWKEGDGELMSFTEANEQEHCEAPEIQGEWYFDTSMWDVILTFGQTNDYFFLECMGVFFLLMNLVVQMVFAIVIGQPSFLGTPTGDLAGQALQFTVFFCPGRRAGVIV